MCCDSEKMFHILRHFTEDARMPLTSNVIINNLATEKLFIWNEFASLFLDDRMAGEEVFGKPENSTTNIYTKWTLCESRNDFKYHVAWKHLLVTR